jgi:hypothetical protein
LLKQKKIPTTKSIFPFVKKHCNEIAKIKTEQKIDCVAIIWRNGFENNKKSNSLKNKAVWSIC